MTGRSVLLNQKWAREAENEKHAKAIKKNYGDYAPVGEMWIKQTKNAAVFKSYGMIAHVLLRWKKPDGSIVDWTSGRNDDILIAPVWALKRKKGF